MKKYDVILTARALAQLEGLHDYIRGKAGSRVATSYIARIHTYCKSLSTFPQRGRKRDEIIPGLRIIGYKRRVTISFVVETDAVVITGVFYGGRDVDSLLTGTDT